MGLYTTKVYYPPPNRKQSLRNSVALQSALTQQGLNVNVAKQERGIASHKLRIQNQLQELGLIKKVPAIMSSTSFRNL